MGSMAWGSTSSPRCGAGLRVGTAIDGYGQTLKPRLRYGTDTAELAVPHLNEADITGRASKASGML